MDEDRVIAKTLSDRSNIGRRNDLDTGLQYGGEETIFRRTRMDWTRMRIKKFKMIFRLQFGEMKSRKKCRRTFVMRNGVDFERTREAGGRQHEGLAVQHGKGLNVVHNCWIILRILSKI